MLHVAVQTSNMSFNHVKVGPVINNTSHNYFQRVILPFSSQARIQGGPRGPRPTP